MLGGDSCEMHGSMVLAVQALKDSCSQIKGMQQQLGEHLHSLTEQTAQDANNLQRHIERQDSLEAALTQSVLELRVAMAEMKEVVRDLGKQDAIFLERLDTVTNVAKSVANGGLTAALEASLPSILTTVIQANSEERRVKTQSDSCFWQSILVAAVTAVGGVIVGWMAK